jgi:signal recognition particle receptor subunit beta
MASVGSEVSSQAVPTLNISAVKILIAGGFGVGKTTMVASVSEITPLTTEENLSAVGATVDDVSGVDSKVTTTVALDFGRITVNEETVLYLFGTPGQERFWFMWDELALGTIGAVVLADTRRLDGCFASVDFFERRGIPFVIGVNCFGGKQIYSEEEVRDALDVEEDIPVVLCDVRERSSSKQVLETMMQRVLTMAS